MVIISVGEGSDGQLAWELGGRKEEAKGLEFNSGSGSGSSSSSPSSCLIHCSEAIDIER